MTKEMEAKIKTGEVIMCKARFNGRVIDAYHEASGFVGPPLPLRLRVDRLKALRKGPINVRLSESPDDLCRNCGEDSSYGSVEFYPISTGDSLCPRCAGARVTVDMWATYELGFRVIWVKTIRTNSGVLTTEQVDQVLRFYCALWRQNFGRWPRMGVMSRRINGVRNKPHEGRQGDLVMKKVKRVPDAALEKLLDYVYHDEEHNYIESTDGDERGHIFVSIRRLALWLDRDWTCPVCGTKALEVETIRQELCEESNETKSSVEEVNNAD
jgi:hypothetical protein